MTTRSDEVEFWQPRYLAGETPWDFHGVPVALTNWLRAERSPGRVLIPGCGYGYEVKAFHAAGWDGMAIDYAPAAVSRARTILDSLGDKVRLADFFHDSFGEKFDVIYERTFLCSMPSDRWPAYVKRVGELLADHGQLVGHFFYGEEPDPPPNPLTEETARTLFNHKFVLLVDEPATDSLPLFAGRERWQIRQKIQSA